MKAATKLSVIPSASRTKPLGAEIWHPVSSCLFHERLRFPRQRKSECAANSDLAAHADGAAFEAGKFFRNRQAQAGSGGAPGKREIGLVDALDAGLISSAQAVEHYEITRYGTLCRWAKELGMSDAEKLLNQTLKEESQTDEDLTKIAEKTVTEAAKSAKAP